MRDFAPKARAAIEAAGGKFLAAGGKTTTIEGEPPKPRITLQQWPSIEQYQAYRNSAAFKELSPLREKLGKFRIFTIEGCLSSQRPNRTIPNHHLRADDAEVGGGYSLAAMPC